MAEALDPSTNAWEHLHGIHNIPKTYIPPFLQRDQDEMQNHGKPEQSIKEKMYDMEIDNQAAGDEFNPNEESLIQINPRTMPGRNVPKNQIDLNQQQNLEDLHEDKNKRQIKDMKFIRLKVKELRIESETLLHKLID